MAHRILYVDSDPSIGGGLISLRCLLKALDRTRYEPIVVHYASHGPSTGIDPLVSEVIELCVHGGRKRRGERAFLRLRQTLVVRSLQSQVWGRRWYRYSARCVNTLLKILPLAIEIQSIVRSRGAALVHVNNSVEFDRAGILAAWLARRPCVCHVRNFEPPLPQSRWFRRHVEGFIFNSEAVAKGPLGSLVEPKRRWVIHNSVDIANYDLAADRSTARRTLGLPVGKPMVGTVGRLERWKGQDIFLRALAQAKRVIPDIQGLVVGAPEPTIPDSMVFAEELGVLAKSLGLSDCVHFAGYRGDIPRVMAALDVVVHCSVEPEPFGRVVIEGMAAGRPVVAVAAGGVLEVVTDGVTGVLVPPGDPETMAAALVGLLKDPVRAARLAMAGRADAVLRFSLEEHARQVEQVYEEVLAGWIRRA
jgi:glycosyltransferase involved in cell wall biosynthesis